MEILPFPSPFLPLPISNLAIPHLQIKGLKMWFLLNYIEKVVKSVIYNNNDKLLLVE
jgi:hypothetical protein